MIKPDWARFYMEAAKQAAFLSKAEKKKVGAVMVLPSGLMSIGINGTPSGWPSEVCEDDEGETLPEVLHAEENLLAKVSRSSISSEGSVVFVTTCPCRNCAKLLISAKVKAVIYDEPHIESVGLELLRKSNVDVFSMEELGNEKILLD